MSTTIQVTLSGSANDAVQHPDGTGFDSTNGTLTLTDHNVVPNSTVFDGGFRFTNVTVPKGALITAADIQIWPDGSIGTADDPHHNIYAEAADNSVSFVTNPDIVSRVLTSASTQWFASNIGTGAYKTSPDISAAIQEIVNRASWASGNALTLIWIGPGTGSNLQCYVSSADAGTPHPALLDITYADPYVGLARDTITPRQAAQRAANR